MVMKLRRPAVLKIEFPQKVNPRVLLAAHLGLDAHVSVDFVCDLPFMGAIGFEPLFVGDKHIRRHILAHRHRSILQIASAGINGHGIQKKDIFQDFSKLGGGDLPKRIRRTGPGTSH